MLAPCSSPSAPHSAIRAPLFTGPLLHSTLLLLLPARNLSCAPVPPPHAACHQSRACVWPSIEAASALPLCHWTLDSRLPTLLLGDFLT
ncbi:unnamed protein product [Staurois parvus]|uniref:Secreted protein n=1 Tax=Staurois parvus TaxID=386267 RepID=A0ABN9B5B4_9NEOB|nr:unnamed protein product [Staurois parvus]